MANEEHLAILKQGVDAWNKWRKENPQTQPDLSLAYLVVAHLSSADFSMAHLIGANLRGAHLNGAKLAEAHLSGADLIGAYLRAADLVGASLSGARLNTADLIGANLNATDLSGADLSGADLSGADFRGANLSEANLDGARVASATFGDVNLSMVKGLETVKHLGPSTIGIDTIYKSKGKIPEVFLRGCGVPDNFITYMASLTGQAWEYYSCFIGHSSKDKRFCDRLYADLQASHVRTWYFPEDATWGKSVWGEIDRSIRIYDKLVVICSENSLQSGPVLREIERALNREDREGKDILFPVRIDDYIFKQWEHPRKADVLAKVVGDFQGWKRSAAKYDKAFKRLLAALQAEDKKR